MRQPRRRRNYCSRPFSGFDCLSGLVSMSLASRAGSGSHGGRPGLAGMGPWRLPRRLPRYVRAGSARCVPGRASARPGGWTTDRSRSASAGCCSGAAPDEGRERQDGDLAHGPRPWQRPAGSRRDLRGAGRRRSGWGGRWPRAGCASPLSRRVTLTGGGRGGGGGGSLRRRQTLITCRGSRVRSEPPHPSLRRKPVTPLLHGWKWCHAAATVIPASLLGRIPTGPARRLPRGRAAPPLPASPAGGPTHAHPGHWPLPGMLDASVDSLRDQDRIVCCTALFSLYGAGTSAPPPMGNMVYPTST